MNTLKYKNMMKSYNGFKGNQTIKAVMNQIPNELFKQLTGHELGLVMSAINTAYHNGKADSGAEIIDDCLWYDNKLIPTQALSAIEIKETIETKNVTPSLQFSSSTEQWTIRQYTLDWKEKF